jgi:hypothetical protein
MEDRGTILNAVSVQMRRASMQHSRRDKACQLLVAVHLLSDPQ